LWERALPAKGKLGLPAGFQRPLESRRGFAPFAGEARSHRVRIWSALTANKKGSSRITGKSGFDLQEEVVAVPVAIGHALDDLDPVVHTLQHAGVETIGGA